MLPCLVKKMSIAEAFIATNRDPLGGVTTLASDVRRSAEARTRIPAQRWGRKRPQTPADCVGFKRWGRKRPQTQPTASAKRWPASGPKPQPTASATSDGPASGPKPSRLRRLQCMKSTVDGPTEPRADRPPAPLHCLDSTVAKRDPARPRTGRGSRPGHRARRSRAPRGR